MTILWIIFLILSAVFGKKWKATKQLLKEAGELLVVISDAIKDDKITREELKMITNEYKDVERIIREIFKTEAIPNYKNILKYLKSKRL